MKTKTFLSSLILIAFAILGGGSINFEALKSTLLIVVPIGVILIIIVFVYENNKSKEAAERALSLINSAPDFNSTRKISISEDLGLLIDDTAKQICILRQKKKKIIGFDQVFDVEYIVNEETIASKSTMRTIGGAVVGGVLAGGVGAIVGGLSGKTKTENKISKIAVKVSIRDIDFPAMNITYFDCKTLPDRKPVAPDSIYCEGAILQAQNFVNTISVIIEEGKRVDVSKPIDQQLTEKQENMSVADEIKKLANLRDEGILTQEEFEKKKASLLS